MLKITSQETFSQNPYVFLKKLHLWLMCTIDFYLSVFNIWEAIHQWNKHHNERSLLWVSCSKAENKPNCEETSMRQNKLSKVHLPSGSIIQYFKPSSGYKGEKEIHTITQVLFVKYYLHQHNKGFYSRGFDTLLIQRKTINYIKSKVKACFLTFQM